MTGDSTHREASVNDDYQHGQRTPHKGETTLNQPMCFDPNAIKLFSERTPQGGEDVNLNLEDILLSCNPYYLI